MEGWIKIYRCLIDKPIWAMSSPEHKVILITILLSANHRDNEWEWQGQKFICKSGQLITSLEKLSEKCGKGVSIQNIRTALKRFSTYNFLTDQPTKTGRLITITNWESYQEDEIPSNIVSNKELTKSQQRANKELTPNKNDKNDKNNKKEILKKEKFSFLKSLIELGVSERVANDWLEVRKLKRAANTETAFNRIKSEIEKTNASAEQCIVLAVEKSWQGFKAEWYANTNQNKKFKNNSVTEYTDKIY